MMAWKPPSDAVEWKPPADTAPAPAPRRNLMAAPFAPKPRTTEEEARRFATESPDSVRLVDALFPRTMAAGRMNPDEISFPWQMIKDIASLPGRVATSRSREETADPTGRNFVETVARDPAALPSAALGGVVPRVAIPATSLAMVTGSKMLDRLTDEDASTGAMPTAKEFAIDAALSMLPDAVLQPAGAALRGAAKKVPEEASKSFMRMMKFLPGQQKMALWKAGKEFADDPALRREVLKGAQNVPDVTANFLAGKEARLRALDPVMAQIDAAGKKVNLDEAMREARSAVLDMEPGTAPSRVRDDAVEWVRQKIMVPAKGVEPEYLREISGVMPSGEIRTAMMEHPQKIPWNALVDLIPSQARRVKTNLDRQIDWQDLTNSEAQGEAAQGAANYIRRAIEEIDPTGTIGAKNREAGRWIAPTLAFERAATRASNVGREGLLQKLRITNPRDTPASIRRLDMLERIYQALGETAPKAAAAPRAAGVSLARSPEKQESAGSKLSTLRRLIPLQESRTDNARGAR